MSDIEILHPNNRAEWLAMRRQDITASAAGALFGIHDYLTPYELWAEKTGRLPETHGETDAMRRGRLLEPVAVQMLCEDRPGWKIEHGSSENVYYRDPVARLSDINAIYVDQLERLSAERPELMARIDALAIELNA